MKIGSCPSRDIASIRAAWAGGTGAQQHLATWRRCWCAQHALSNIWFETWHGLLAAGLRSEWSRIEPLDSQIAWFWKFVGVSFPANYIQLSSRDPPDTSTNNTIHPFNFQPTANTFHCCAKGRLSSRLHFVEGPQWITPAPGTNPQLKPVSFLYLCMISNLLILVFYISGWSVSGLKIGEFLGPFPSFGSHDLPIVRSSYIITNITEPKGVM